jgi:Tfp pilus assembly protein PilN
VAAQKKTINFLPGDKLEKSPLGIFLKWALAIGRHIIIFTELIVIVVFLIRFKLDKDLIDLHEEIVQKQNLVAASAELENEARFLQQRLEVISKIQPEGVKSFLILKELSEIIPLDVVFSELAIQPDSISLEGTSFSNAGLATLISGLKSSDYFEQLDIKTVSSKGERDSALEFEIGAVIIQKQLR